MSTLSELAKEVIASGQADLHVRTSIKRIDELESTLNSLLLCDREFVEAQISDLQKRLDGGERLSLIHI